MGEAKRRRELGLMMSEYEQRRREGEKRTGRRGTMTLTIDEGAERLASIAVASLLRGGRR